MSQSEPAPADHCFVYQSGGWPDSIRGREEREMIRRSMDAAENSWTLITGRLLGHHEIISCHFPFSLQNGKPRPRESQGGTCPETHRELKPEPGVGRENLRLLKAAGSLSAASQRVSISEAPADLTAKDTATMSGREREATRDICPRSNGVRR